jgi:hypothetical protein
MITGKIVTGTTITTPTTVYTSSGTNAITTLVLCNTGAPNSSDELENSITVNIYLIDPSSGGDNATVNAGALVVSNLIVPAGETVFFSEERIVLDNNDYVAVGYKMTDSGASPVNNLLTVTVSTLTV